MAHRSVLLVDDDRLLLELYALALREHGYTVHQASDEATARVVAAHTRPDVAVVDGRIADVRAGALAGELGRQGVTVVLFTNDQELYDRPPAGVSARLVKVNTSPFALAEFLDRLMSQAGVGLAG